VRCFKDTKEVIYKFFDPAKKEIYRVLIRNAIILLCKSWR